MDFDARLRSLNAVSCITGASCSRHAALPPKMLLILSACLEIFIASTYRVRVHVALLNGTVLYFSIPSSTRVRLFSLLFRFADAVPVKMADGNRNALYAVAENGSVYSWSGVLELDGSGGGGSLKKLHGATTGGEFDSLLRQRAAVAAAENLAQRQVASAAAAATDVASVMIASQDASTDDDRDRPAAFSVERPDLLPFRASSLRFITQPPELVSGLVNQRIVRVACGSNYVLACGGAYTRPWIQVVDRCLAHTCVSICANYIFRVVFVHALLSSCTQVMALYSVGDAARTAASVMVVAMTSPRLVVLHRCRTSL